MNDYKEEGIKIRELSKQLVLQYMRSEYECCSTGGGIRQREIGRNCGLEWGDKEKSTASNQNYWTVALLQELKEENLVQQDIDSKKWRLT